MLGAVSRVVSTAIASTDTLSLDGHGFEDGDEIQVSVLSGGSLPSPLAAGVTYYAIRVDAGQFQLSATSGGAAINLTTNGLDVFVSTPLPDAEVRELYSRELDGMLPAHAFPLTAPYPVQAVDYVATRAAAHLARLAGHVSESLDKAAAAAVESAKRWAAGIPIRDARVSTSTNRAVARVSTADPRGYGSGLP